MPTQNIPLEVVIPFIGGALSRNKRFDGSVVLFTGSHFTPLSIEGKTVEEVQAELKQRNPDRVDFASSERRPLVIDFEYNRGEGGGLDSCTCTNGECDVCFSFVDTVSQAFAHELQTMTGIDPVRFYSGGRGFHLYLHSDIAWTPKSVTAVLNRLIRRVSSQLRSDKVRNAVDVAASAPSHNMRVPLSTRSNNRIVCLAPPGFDRANAPIITTCQRSVFTDGAAAMLRALANTRD